MMVHTGLFSSVSTISWTAPRTSSSVNESIVERLLGPDMTNMYHQQKVCPGRRRSMLPSWSHRPPLHSDLLGAQLLHGGAHWSSRRGAGIWHAHSILVQFGMQKSSPGANFLIGMKARPPTVNLSFFECL